jgi:cupin superfamily acireductone dioxygenase involved in methionine salvage
MLVEHQVSEIADEQGSASADVVWHDYLSAERRRELRRQFMREKLSAAFESRDGN